MKAWLLVVCLAAAGCASNREILPICGTIAFADGLPPPPGYVLTLDEGRSYSLLARVRQPLALDSRVTIAVVTPSEDGSFALDAFVCEEVSLRAIYAGGAFGRRDDPIWQSPIHIVADERETEYIRAQTWPLPLQSLDQSQAEEFAQDAAEFGGPERVPCTWTLRNPSD